MILDVQEYDVEVIAKRRKDRPEEAMARWLDEEWAQERLEHIRERDKDGRNPFAWGDIWVIVTLKPFDEYYQKGRLKERFRLSQPVLGASYHNAEEFIRTERYQEVVDQCIERIKANLSKVGRGSLIFYMMDTLNAKDEHISEVFSDFPPDNKCRIAWENRDRDPDLWEEWKEKLRSVK